MEKRKRIFTVTVLAVYAVLLVWLVLFKLETDLTQLSRYRRVLLVPFVRPDSMSFGFEVSEMLLNLLAFLPLGYWLAMLGFPKKAWARVFTAFCVSLAFEVLQYVFYLGTSDVTDLICNTAGALLGGFAFLGARRMLGHRTETVSNITGLCVMLLLTGAWIFLSLMN